MILEHEERHSVFIAVPKASLLACRVILYEHGLGVQEMLSQFLKLIENKDPRAMSIISTAKNNKIANVRTSLVVTSARSLYAVLQKHSPFRNVDDDEEEGTEEHGSPKEESYGNR